MKNFFEQQDKKIDGQLFVILLVDLAKQRGIPPDKLLRGTRLFHKDLAKPHVPISHTQFVKLIQNVNVLMKQSDVPFLLGSRLFPTYLGHVGMALMNANNLIDMLRIIKCYQYRIFPYMFVVEKRHKQRHYLLFNHAIAFVDEQYHQFMCELLSTVLISALKWRSPNLPEIKIRYPYSQPSHIEQYQSYLSTAFTFNSSYEKQSVKIKKTHFYLQISFDASALKTTFPTRNNVIKRHHLNQLPYERPSVGIIQCVIETLASLLCDKNVLSLESVASSLEVSPATLKRKLAAHNTSYQRLLDLYRQQQAIFQLTEQGINNQDIATALDFSDCTNFRRSFKRWTGLTPQALKQVFKQDEQIQT